MDCRVAIVVVVGEAVVVVVVVGGEVVVVGGVVVRDWGFIDLAGADPETVWAISTEIEQHVIELINDLPTQAD